MKSRLFYFLFQVSYLMAFGQIDTQSLKIVDAILRKEQPLGKIVYTNRLNINEVSAIKKGIRNKYFFSMAKLSMKPIRNFLTSVEISHLDAELTKLYKLRWRESLFSNSKRIPEDSMWAYITQQNKERYESYTLAKQNNDTTLLKDFNKVVYSNVFQFTPPLYLRNRTIFLFFVLRMCGGLCGINELSFYKAQNGSYKKWVMIEGGAF